MSTSPEILVERIVQDLQKTSVYIGEEILLAPLQAIGVCAGGVGGVESRLLLTGAPIPVILLVGTPMESRCDNVISARRIAVVVASRLGNIDFARCGPGSECVVDGQQPDGRPEPITHWHLGYHFDPTIFERRTFEGIDAAGFDRRDDGAVGGVCGSIAVIVLRGRAVGKSQVVVGREERFVLQGRLDDELAILDHDILFRAGSHVKFAVSKSNCQQAGWRSCGSDTTTYPKPPRFTSLVQISVLNPLLQSSSKINLYV